MKYFVLLLAFAAACAPALSQAAALQPQSASRKVVIFDGGNCGTSVAVSSSGRRATIAARCDRTLPAFAGTTIPLPSVQPGGGLRWAGRWRVASPSGVQQAAMRRWMR